MPFALIPFEGGFIVVNAQDVAVSASSGEIAVSGLFIHIEGCMTGVIGFAKAEKVRDRGQPPAGNPSINLVVTRDCTEDGATASGTVRIANTSSGSVVVEQSSIIIFWQSGGGNWVQADPQTIITDLNTGVVIPKDDQEHEFEYAATFTGSSAAAEYRVVAQVKLQG